MDMKVGVLALQGSFKEHYNSLVNLGYFPVLVKSKVDLDKVDLLIIPGGESTVISQLLVKNGLFEIIKKRVNKSLAVWGTCAGSILLSNRVIGATDGQQFFNAIDITIERNAYGAALDSFESNIYVKDINKEIPAVFIRAPKIKTVSDRVVVLAKDDGGNIVAAYQDKCLVTTFHPELTSDFSFHQYFVKNFS